MSKVRTVRGTALSGVAALAVVAALAGAVPASAQSPTSVRPPVTVAADRTATTYLVLPAGTLPAAADAVAAAGGQVTKTLAGVGQLVATLDATQVTALRRAPAIRAVTPNASVALSGSNYDQLYDPGAPQKLVDATKARDLWRTGITGRGVDVALLDTGVAPAAGLDGNGKIVVGADLSFDSQDASIAGRDTYGHGSHIGGLIAGRDASVSDPVNFANDQYVGIAPDARLVSVKLGDQNGAVDITQVIAGIDWVVQHKNDNGLNIRVLNLSFGTDSTQPYGWDPLAYAAEIAWKKGIVVVAAAGNAGTDTNPNALGLTDPAYDPTILAVGATDMRGTSNTGDDVIPAFSSRGANGRDPDVVAPGRSLIGVRVPGSGIDQQFSSAEVGSRFFRGSGTSQAAGVVSGGVALILQKNPNYSPDQVKAVLKATASSIAGAPTNAQGAGAVNFYAAATRGLNGLNVPTPAYNSSGSGSIEGSRGTDHVVMDGVALKGEQDIFGIGWSSSAMAGAESGPGVWIGGYFNSVAWTGSAWNSSGTWSGRSWSGATWSGRSWSGRSWSGRSWSGRSWSNGGWSTGRWGGGTGVDAADTWSSSTWG